jgi:hypothetical protein
VLTFFGGSARYHPGIDPSPTGLRHLQFISALHVPFYTSRKFVERLFTMPTMISENAYLFLMNQPLSPPRLRTFRRAISQSAYRNLWFSDNISDGGAGRNFPLRLSLSNSFVPVRVLSFRVLSDAFAREGVQCRGRSPRPSVRVFFRPLGTC